MTNLRAHDFTGAVKLLGDSTERITIGNNTTIEAIPVHVKGDAVPVQTAVQVRLHGHAIIRLFANGDVEVRDCGYTTATTYERFNQFLPPGWVAQRRGGCGYVTKRLGLDGPFGVGSDTWTLVKA